MSVVLNKESDVLWVAADGSYGIGNIVVIDMQGWTPQQYDWMTEITIGDDPSIADVLAIDAGISPHLVEEPNE